MNYKVNKPAAKRSLQPDNISTSFHFSLISR